MGRKKSDADEGLLSIFRHCYSLMREKEIGEFRFGKSGIKIFIKRKVAERSVQKTKPSVSAENKAGGQETEKILPVKEISGREVIKSPLAGVFYASPSPNSASYISVPSDVKKGQILCMIEAMKVMNEIESPSDCRILSVVAKSGAMVGKGDPLFEIEK
ncbi:MAG: acetyl-CoA carboxylase, biotin carboxyl carrier protein [Elusimicrobia bacterium CG08_land_8_20_14_0_20_44_26]|nr:MAG: acetyl-CoA carboxylase, biotin carboxyl carrier protein [Elusimicrobia bacterium CG08_land_8_20_14_0_20_44_26]